MPADKKILENRVLETANRLRLIQVDFADKDSKARDDYLCEEIERALKTILPDERKEDQDVKDLIKFVFSSMIHIVSRLIMLKRGKEAGWNTPEYLVLGAHPEYNVWDRFENRYKKILRGKQKISEKISYYKEAEKFDKNINKINDKKVGPIKLIVNRL